MYAGFEEQLPLEMKKRCYFFNSFFYTKLAEKVIKDDDSRVGMPSPGLWVPERESQGAGVLVGVSFRRSSSGGRREGGTRWSHECGILTKTSLDT